LPEKEGGHLRCPEDTHRARDPFWGNLDILKPLPGDKPPALMLLLKLRLLHSFRIYVSGRRKDGSPGGVWEEEDVYIIDGHSFLKGVLRL
jgi:hypothetical protein